RNFPEKINLLKHYGYIGAFLISLFGNGSIFLPATVLPILTSLSLTFFPVTGILGPVFIAIAGGAGAALGETVGYTLGYSGRKIIIKKKTYTRFELWVRRWGAITIFVFSFVPFFFDFVGLAAGALHFPLWKFILISFIGRTIFYFCVFLVTIFGVMKLF
ncbi:MAG: VTT domain-containing protein, partial [candidate division WOR-3 bacterium]